MTRCDRFKSGTKESFKESGTMIGFMAVIDKQEEKA